MRLAIVGTGLIGGSIGLAARARLGATVLGVDPDPEPALAAGAIDAAVGLDEALAGAEVAFVAVPVTALQETVAAALAAAPADCAVTDVGSVKRALVEATSDERFVGGHPLAGSEAAGAAHARADLFEGATWYLTPGPTTSGLRLQALRELTAALGARPAIIEAASHDRMMAAVSHLPHVLANVLVAGAEAASGGEGLPPAGPSFRDATRVAGAHPELWAQIYAANRDALIEAIDGARAALGEVRERLLAGEDLRGWQAASARPPLRGVADETELLVVVPNRPGVVAEVALTMARAHINIGDMSLAPSADMATGALTLSIPAEHAPRAVALLAELGLRAR